MANLALAIGWILTILIGIMGALVVVKMAIGGTNGIDLKHLINDEQGHASLARFQFLIFTFVIAMSLFLIIASKTPADYPEHIPNQILALLGISGGSYVVSKGIQSSRDQGLKGTGDGTQPDGSSSSGSEAKGSGSADSKT
jgi:hypothetical protein